MEEDIEVAPNINFNLCRLCLNKQGKYVIKPPLIEQILFCYDIAIEPWDGLPQLLCLDCRTKLVACSTEKSTKIEIQKKLLENRRKENMDGVMEVCEGVNMNLCRLCFLQQGKYIFKPPLIEQIKVCYQIAIEPWDGLPQLLCLDCKTQLTNFYSEKTKFMAEQNRLREKKTQTHKRVDDNTSSSGQEAVNHLKKAEENCEQEADSSSQVVTSIETLPVEPLDANMRKPDYYRIITKPGCLQIKISTSSRSDFNLRFKCRFCSKYFKFSFLVKKHVRREHENILQRWHTLCPKQFKVKLQRLEKVALERDRFFDGVALEKSRIVTGIGNEYYSKWLVLKNQTSDENDPLVGLSHNSDQSISESEIVRHHRKKSRHHRKSDGRASRKEKKGNAKTSIAETVPETSTKRVIRHYPKKSRHGKPDGSNVVKLREKQQVLCFSDGSEPNRPETAMVLQQIPKKRKAFRLNSDKTSEVETCSLASQIPKKRKDFRSNSETTTVTTKSSEDHTVRTQGLSTENITHLKKLVFDRYRKQVSSNASRNEAVSLLNTYILNTKLLNVGTKTMVARGTNSVEMLEFLEEKPLEILWRNIKKPEYSAIFGQVQIKTKLMSGSELQDSFDGSQVFQNNAQDELKLKSAKITRKKRDEPIQNSESTRKTQDKPLELAESNSKIQDEPLQFSDPTCEKQVEPVQLSESNCNKQDGPIQLSESTRKKQDGCIQLSECTRKNQDGPIQLTESTRKKQDAPIQLSERTRIKQDFPIQLSESARKKENGPIQLSESAHKKQDGPIQLSESARKKENGPIQLSESAHKKQDGPIQLSELTRKQQAAPIQVCELTPKKQDLPIQLSELTRKKQDAPIQFSESTPKNQDEPIKLSESARQKENGPIQLSESAHKKQVGPIQLSECTRKNQDRPIQLTESNRKKQDGPINFSKYTNSVNPITLLNATPVANPKPATFKPKTCTVPVQSVENAINLPTDNISIFKEVDSVKIEPIIPLRIEPNTICLDSDDENTECAMPVITKTTSLAEKSPTLSGLLDEKVMTSEANITAEEKANVTTRNTEQASIEPQQYATTTDGVIESTDEGGFGLHETICLDSDGEIEEVTAEITSTVCLSEDDEVDSEASASDVKDIKEEKPTVSNQTPIQLTCPSLPHFNTNSPVEYLYELLKLHGIAFTLLWPDPLPTTFHLLANFKLESSVLSIKVQLYLDINVAYIRVESMKDDKGVKFESMVSSWQWEVLKSFQDAKIVDHMVAKARKIGGQIKDICNTFINLLATIERVPKQEDE